MILTRGDLFVGAGLLYLTKRCDILIPHHYHLILLLPPNTVGTRSKRQHQASPARGTVNRWICVLKTTWSLLMTVPLRLLWRPNPQAFIIHLTNSTANLGRIRDEVGKLTGPSSSS